MTGDKITYGESIECPGKWRRMDYETTVKEGETEQSAGNRAQSFVQNFLSQNNPHLYQEQESYNHIPIVKGEFINPANILLNSQTIDSQPEKISPEQEIADILKGIEESTAENLHTWILLAAKNKKTMGAFNKRKKQLNIQ